MRLLTPWVSFSTIVLCAISLGYGIAMALESESYSSANNTASLDLYVGEALVTSYALANGGVTLSARANSDTLSYAQLRENVSRIHRWIVQAFCALR